jgi:hypothetical protein
LQHPTETNINRSKDGQQQTTEKSPTGISKRHS